MKKTFVIAITWATYGAFAEKYHLMRRVLHSPQVVTVITLQVVFLPVLSVLLLFFFFAFIKFWKLLTRCWYSTFFSFPFRIPYLGVRKTFARGADFSKLIFFVFTCRCLRRHSKTGCILPNLGAQRLL